MDYNARVELDRRLPADDSEADDMIDQLMDDLAPYHVAVARTPHGRVELILTVPAESLRQASSTVLAVVAAAGGEPFALEVLPTDEFDRRSEQEMVPAMLSVTGTAELLGVTRARVQQLIDDGQLAAVKVGATWAVLRSSAEARATGAPRAADKPEVISYG